MPDVKFTGLPAQTTPLPADIFPFITDPGGTPTGKKVTFANIEASLTVANQIGGTATGTGNLVRATSPSLVTPALGTPTALVGTNITGTAAGLTAGNVTTNANLTGPVTSTGNATAIANGAISNAMLANSAVANLSGTNTGDQTSVSGNAGTATALATPRTIGTATGDVTSAGSPFDGSANNTNALTLATVNGNVGSFGSATQVGTFTANAKGLITAAGNTTIAIPSTAVTDFTEAAQDAVGAMIDSTLVYVDATPLLTRAALTGDVTAPQASNTTTIANDAVTYAKMQNVSATDKLLGRSTAGAGDVEEIACTAAGRALLDDANAAAQVTTLGLDNTKIADITYGFEGTVPSTGLKISKTVSYACTINSATLIATTSGSIVIDIKKSTYANFPTTSSICASAKPTLSSAQKSQDTTLTGWTTSIAAGDVIEFYIDSVTTLTACTLTLKVTKT